MRGEHEVARNLYTGAQALLAELGATVIGASTALASYAVEVLAGDLPAAERELKRDYEALERMQERYLRSTVAAELARVLYAQGRVAEAEELSLTAQALAAEDDIASQALWRSVRSKVLASRQERQAALTLIREAVALVERTDASMIRGEVLMDFEEVLRVSERAREADEILEQADAILLAKLRGETAPAGESPGRPFRAVSA
jgi:hypothetical protein